MYLSSKGLANKDSKLNSSNKLTTLNPNAAEFVPSVLRKTYGNTERSDATRLDVPGSSKQALLDQSQSSISSNSDDEAHRFWHCQLPDDITPDFRVMGEEELHGPGHLSLVGLSIQDGVETSRFSTSTASQTLGMRQNLSSFTSNGINLGENMGYSGSIHTDEHSSADFMTSTSSSWGKHFINAEQHQTNGMDGHHYNGESGAVSVNDLIGDSAVIKDAAINPIEFLSSQFPGFAAQSLAAVYYGNGCDLNLTTEILTQLKLQVDGGFNQDLNSKSLATPSLCMLDFPALPVADAQNGLLNYPEEDTQQPPNTYRSASSIFRGDGDFASTVRKLATQSNGHWGYERSGSADGGLHSSRSSQLLASSYVHGKMAYGDKLQSSGATRVAPVWLETGEAVASLYSESREDAHDFACLGNTCFEQARQAYLLGSKPLAKELGLKGQLYNMQMKAAHEKAKETIYRKRNPVSPALQACSVGQDHLIDVHGLHATEAMHVLDRELSMLRSRARSSGRRLQVMICVGAGHHTRGARTPARLPAAVEQYLVEEGLPYTRPQPGLLRVVIY